MFDASSYIDLRRLPELVCGFPRRRGRGRRSIPLPVLPRLGPPGSLPSLLQSCLGLSFEPSTRTVVFDRPVLPSFLDEVILRNLAIGRAGIDVVLRGSGGGVAMQVLSRTGDIRATMTS